MMVRTREPSRNTRPDEPAHARRAVAIIIISAHLAGGCSLFQKSDLVRTQKQRNAANKYAAGNWMERVDAVKEIVRYIGPDKNDLIFGTLMVASGDPYQQVRMEAVKGLAIVKNQECLSMLRRIASSDPADNVRWLALRELRGLGDPAAADIFIRALDSEDWLIREEAARGITSLDKEIIRSRMIPHILKAINDPDVNVVLAVLNTITVRDPRLYRAIADRLTAGSDYSLLEASLKAINGYRLDEKTKEKVIDLLVYNNSRIRVLALRVLKSDQALVESGKKTDP
ncbi:MAG: HEAT repeat domain-containing protein [Spirochaetes bacterium]|nr:HEAT repeat domain-containing protein [Spirochaetota bacterium]